MIEIPVTQTVIYGWYDNELGSYTNMLGDRTVSIARLMRSLITADQAGLAPKDCNRQGTDDRESLQGGRKAWQIRVAINGFGRIGRIVFKAIVERGEPLQVMAINDIGAVDDLAHLLQYDSVHGVWPHRVTTEEDKLLVDGEELSVPQGGRSVPGPLA